jgi:putative colanic acid biosynthesis acetyltransferase WcaF
MENLTQPAVDHNPRPRVQDLASFTVPADFRGRSVFIVQLWWIVQSTLFRLSPDFMYSWRSWLLRLFGAQLGQGVRIRPSAQITYPWKLKVGDHTWIGSETVLYNLGEIEIGSNVAIAHRVYLCTGTHDYEDPQFSVKAFPIVIEDEVWLPNDIFIAPGVRIGRGAVVGARSSVFKDLPPMTVCYGNPAKPVRLRLLKKSDLGAE